MKKDATGRVAEQPNGPAGDLRSSDATPVWVASVPATHVYVRRLEHPAVRRLADPSGDDLRTPCFLDPDWVRDNGDSFDLLHVHFGFEFYDPSRLAAVCDELSRQEKPLVFTTHDLRNPNHPSPELHDAGLALWMERADEVVTLTGGAAAEIHRRFGRRATVIPHPHVLPMGELKARWRRPRSRHRDRLRVGIHFKSLRANMVGTPLLRAALDGVRELEGVRLRVDLHCDVVDPASRVHDPGLLALALEAVAEDLTDLHVHNYFSDDELWDYLGSVDAVLLPYRFGTHSGLLEACRDLGTAVIAPSCGYYAEQGAHHLFEASEWGGLNGESVAHSEASKRWWEPCSA
jgi:glycosyltransferase involved in cell wall biosynthesis